MQYDGAVRIISSPPGFFMCWEAGLAAENFIGAQTRPAGENECGNFFAVDCSCRPVRPTDFHRCTFASR